MMAFLKPLNVPRSRVAHENPVVFEDGTASIEFYTPTSLYIGNQVIPPDNKFSDGTHCFMSPPSHSHALQRENFHVKSGSGIWHLAGKTIRLNAGDNLVVPLGYSHRFVNEPGSTEPLVIEWSYDERRWRMEERFFRNTLPYLNDCRLHGVKPSFPQMCLFLADAWMPPDAIHCPGGEYVRCIVNLIYCWIMAAIGKYVYGYKASYSEYYDPEHSEKRMMPEKTP